MAYRLFCLIWIIIPYFCLIASLIMDKGKMKLSENSQSSFSDYKSYSVSEILAAGGTTAFANKLGKNPKNIEDYLAQLPEGSFLTEKEATQALKILDESK